MTKTHFAVQMGMGTDLKGQDYTKTAARAVNDALHRNFLAAGAAFDLPLEAMIVDIRVGVHAPAEVNLDVVKAEAPAGRVSAEAVWGGLQVEMMDHTTLIANAIVTVSYNLEQQS